MTIFRTSSASCDPGERGYIPGRLAPLQGFGLDHPFDEASDTRSLLQEEVLINPRRSMHLLVCASLVVACAGCSGEGDSGAGSTTPRTTTLRVPLYPYIPDAAGDQFKALSLRIEAEFEAAHPEVDLVVNPPCFEDDVYDPQAISKGLSREASECGYDMAEIDTFLLRDVVAAGAIRPWDELPSGITWHPAAVEASTVEGELFGVPHWACGYFVFSRDEAIRKAGSVSALLQALKDAPSPAPNMAVNLLGSWDTPALYLDAWADTNGVAGVASVLASETYDAAVLEALRQVALECQENAENPCTDGTYDRLENFDLPAQRFAAGEVDATLGFSERLHTILKSSSDPGKASAISISIAPLGEGNHPLLFTDSFVVSKRCVEGCAEAAVAFVEYMSASSTYEWILMSEDAAEDGRVPRYLMPPSLDAYAAPKLAADPYYAAIKADTQTGVNFPNGGLFAKKDAMRDDIVEAITAPLP
jgi:thiamine pyridinylase